MRSVPLAVPALALVLATLAAPLLFATPASARVWKQAWAVGARPKVRIVTNDAHVALHRGVPGQVAARVEYTVQVWGLHTGVHEPLVQLERSGDSIVVTARERSTLAVFVVGSINERFRVDVTLPPECDVTVRSKDGAVEAEPLAGTIDLETGDGRITVQGARGRVRLWTGDGGIVADSLDGDVTARTGDGRLRLSGRFDALDVRSGDGRVETTVLRGSTLAQPWSLATGDGSVLLRIPRNLRALLDAETEDGGVHVDLPVSLAGGLSRHSLRGSLNGGTVPLRVRTNDGSIRLALAE